MAVNASYTLHVQVAEALRVVGYDATTRPEKTGPVYVQTVDGLWTFEDYEAPMAGYNEEGSLLATGDTEPDAFRMAKLPTHDDNGATAADRLHAILGILHGEDEAAGR